MEILFLFYNTSFAISLKDDIIKITKNGSLTLNSKDRRIIMFPTTLADNDIEVVVSREIKICNEGTNSCAQSC